MIALTPDQRQTVERKFRNLGTGREQLPGMVATKAQVVARSPDLATRPTEGLQSRLQPGDLRSRSRRGLETTAVNIFGTARNRWKNREISRSDDCTTNSFGGSAAATAPRQTLEKPP